MNRTQTTYRVSGLLLIALAFSCGCNRKETPAKETNTEPVVLGKPVITAVEPEYKFGTVKQGAEVEHTFKIKNTGDQNLVIEKTTGS